ncbi:MAG TPA: FecR domain-containing protein [Leptospiraceae bacterium]|nr:FecR domain-containing protein [Leptospiraceae bacterium]HMW05082.1 FecR domain-containing protein [Leptospiraceae bacterium]HMX31336.1 FecR domain-containing protein [Leptospiraceae bacterium]HMY31621.1 FecR domain-containing protein [Leptospiraceae bacterium]HMZ62635.1 FecR domain-containing protein [Leptospiraceae bacterium]
MKNIIILFLFLYQCHKIQTQFNPSTVVLVSVGNVLSEEKKIKVGDKVSFGQNLKVGKNSFCDLQIIDAESIITIRLQPETEFVLRTKITPNQNIIRPRIIKGEAFFNIVKLSKKEEFTVVASAIKATVKGTQFYIEVDSNGKTKLAVNEGYVLLKPGVIELDDLPLEKIKHLANAQSIIESENQKELNVPTGHSVSVSNEMVKKTNQFIESIASAENPNSSIANEISRQNYFTKEDIQKLNQEEEEEYKKVFLELPPLPTEYSSNPEKLRLAVLSRIHSLSETISIRMESILQRRRETLITYDGRKIHGIVYSEKDFFNVITLNGIERIPVKEAESIILYYK